MMARRRAEVSHVDPDDLDPVDPDAIHDDAEDTDHLWRLHEPGVRDAIEHLVNVIAGTDERRRTRVWDELLTVIADIGRDR